MRKCCFKSNSQIDRGMQEQKERMFFEKQQSDGYKDAKTRRENITEKIQHCIIM